MADKKPAEITPLQSGIIGGIVGGVEITITYPIEYLKTVMQLNKHFQKMGLVGITKHVYNTQGFLGLYRGYSSLLVFAIPKATVRFGGFQFA